MSDDLPILDNLRHQRFADFVINGDKPGTAYQKAGYSAKNPQVAAVNASRLMKDAKVKAYIRAAQMKAAQGAVLSLRAKREFLARIVKTPLLQINPRGEDGDLIKKYKVTKNGEGGVTEEIEKLDPLKAIDLDNKLSGEDPESNAIGSLADALAGIAGTDLPDAGYEEQDEDMM